jgi:ABC-type proline/glycine betaine transport system ATPase subunit
MVMDAGQVGEYGSPRDLLRDPKSLFSQLIAAEKQQERDGGFGNKDSQKNNENVEEGSADNNIEPESRVPDKSNIVDNSVLIEAADPLDVKVSVKALR